MPLEGSALGAKSDTAAAAMQGQVGEAVAAASCEGGGQRPQVVGGGELADEVARWCREECPGCNQRAMFYCPFCCRPLGVPEGVTVPRVRLPFLRCDVVFDDAAKKATSVHAKVLAPEQVRLIDLFTSDGSANRTLSRNGGAACAEAPREGDAPPDGAAGSAADTATVREIPEYDPRTTAVLFPDDGSLPLGEIPASWDLAPPSAMTLIVIDAPWRRAQVLRKHPRLASLRSVRLREPPTSRFWRYHAEGRGCVSTIEALAAVARELEAPPAAAAEAPAAEAADSSAAVAQDLAPAPAPDHPLLFFFARQLAHIAARSGSKAELPTDEAAKERRSARVRQKDRAKRMRPLGAADVSEGVTA